MDCNKQQRIFLKATAFEQTWAKFDDYLGMSRGQAITTLRKCSLKADALLSAPSNSAPGVDSSLLERIKQDCSDELACLESGIRGIRGPRARFHAVVGCMKVVEARLARELSAMPPPPNRIPSDETPEVPYLGNVGNLEGDFSSHGSGPSTGRASSDPTTVFRCLAEMMVNAEYPTDMDVNTPEHSEGEDPEVKIERKEKTVNISPEDYGNLVPCSPFDKEENPMEQTTARLDTRKMQAYVQPAYAKIVDLSRPVVSRKASHRESSDSSTLSIGTAASKEELIFDEAMSVVDRRSSYNTACTSFSSRPTSRIGSFKEDDSMRMITVLIPEPTASLVSALDGLQDKRRKSGFRKSAWMIMEKLRANPR